MEVRSKREAKDLVGSKKGPMVIFFYWNECGHCEAMMEPWKNITSQMSDVRMVKMESRYIPESLGINGFPTFWVIKSDSEEPYVISGQMEEAQLMSEIQKGLGRKRGGRRSRRLTRRRR